MRERANIGKMFFGSGSSKSNSRRSSIRRRSILSPASQSENGKNDDILSKDSKLESEIGISAKDLSPVQKLNNKTLFMTEKRELVEKKGGGFPRLDPQSKQFLHTMENLNINAPTKGLLREHNAVNNMDEHEQQELIDKRNKVLHTAHQPNSP